MARPPRKPPRPHRGNAASAAAGRRLNKSTGGGGTTRVSYGGGGGGSRVRSNSSGRYGAVPPPPSVSAGGGPVPDIGAFLTGDAGYQNQLRQFMKALTDFSADANRRKGILESEYGVSKKALADQRVMDLESLKEDFGSRGLLRSGLYADEVGDYEKEYGLRVTDIDRRQQQALQQLLQERNQYQSQNTLQQQAAKEAALRRRAEQYGI